MRPGKTKQSVASTNSVSIESSQGLTVHRADLLDAIAHEQQVRATDGRGCENFAFFDHDYH